MTWNDKPDLIYWVIFIFDLAHIFVKLWHVITLEIVNMAQKQGRIRKVLLAVDGSEQSNYAVKCEALLSLSLYLWQGEWADGFIFQ